MNAKQREEVLRAIIADIRDFAAELAKGSWEDHGSDFERIVKMCDQAPDEAAPRPRRVAQGRVMEAEAVREPSLTDRRSNQG